MTRTEFHIGQTPLVDLFKHLASFGLQQGRGYVLDPNFHALRRQGVAVIWFEDSDKAVICKMAFVVLGKDDAFRFS